MILIIDSEKVPDSKISQYFHESGFESVLVAKTAAAAREIIAENNNEEISLIIIDSELDDAKGFELCSEIRKTAAGKKAYIILLVSSTKNKTAIEKAKHCGASDFSVKPYHSPAFETRFVSYLKQKVVMLVDDDPVIRKMVRAILFKYHVEVIEVADGVEANNLFNTLAPVCMVLMDIGLPNMNGIQLVKKIRVKASWKKVPVLMLTGSSDISDVKKCLSVGANDYITKPFKVDDFINRLKRYLPDGN